MREHLSLLIHLLVALAKLFKPGGVKAVMAENIAMRQQLITLSRARKRAPNLTTFDRFLFGCVIFFIGEKRLQKIAIILKPATFLNLHKTLVKRKYRQLYSNKAKKKTGRKSRDQALIDLVVEMKKRNPSFGYGRIAMQIFECFGIEISRFAVGRILRKNKHKLPAGDGPSWLTCIGHMKDTLWSVDLFRCESIALKSHWFMVIMDQFSRRIIGFSVHAGDPDGIVYCRLFNEIVAGKCLPKYLSSDNDPLFLVHRWHANLRILEVDEIKSIPGVPTSHPFIERLIGTCRRECVDRSLFWNARDLQRKLVGFQKYCNETRVHSSLAMETPNSKADECNINKNVASLHDYRWRSHASYLYHLPIAA